MADLKQDIEALRKEKTELEDRIKGQAKGFLSRIIKGDSAQLKTRLDQITEKLQTLEQEVRQDEIEKEAQQEAKHFFVQDESGEVKIREGLLQEGLALFRDTVPEIEDPEEKIKVMDTLIKKIAFTLLEGIKDKDGKVDTATEAQAYFAIGVTYLDKAELRADNIYYRYAHNAFEIAKKLASVKRRSGLVFQLNGAIERIKENYPDYDGKHLDCFRTKDYDYVERFEVFRKAVTSPPEEGEEIVFDAD